jgi:hypothetical protein
MKDLSRKGAKAQRKPFGNAVALCAFAPLRERFSSLAYARDDVRTRMNKQQLIVEVWEGLAADAVGAAELAEIQRALRERLGDEASPASIARTLADHGARLGHPDVLEVDLRWREGNTLFTPEDLTFGTLEAATALIEKIERLRAQFEIDDSRLEHLRKSVRQIKSELELPANNNLAQELAQWLTIWLQSPKILSEWLALRRATPEFKQQFEQ